MAVLADRDIEKNSEYFKHIVSVLLGIRGFGNKDKRGSYNN